MIVRMSDDLPYTDNDAFVNTDLFEHVIRFCLHADFQLGFEHSTYEIGEDNGLVNDVIYIVKMNENILQKNYLLTINVFHDTGNYSAVLSKCFNAESNFVGTCS